MTDLSSTIAALREMRASRPMLKPRWLKAIDEAVEGLEGRYWAGIVEDWKARAEAAESKLATASEALEEAEKVIGVFVEAALEADGNERPDWSYCDDRELIPSMPFDLTAGDFRAAQAWQRKYGKAGSEARQE